MKFTISLMLLICFDAVASKSYSQDVFVTINMDDAYVKNVLKEIEKRTELFFIYNNKLINVDKKVSVHAENKEIKEVLDILFQGEDVTYTLVDKQIILSPKRTSQLQENQLSIKGRVVDANGLPLPGVSVIIKGTSQGTITDLDGNYNLSNISANSLIVFSFIGFVDQEFTITEDKVINLTLQEEVTDLDEVVVVGFGVQKKINLTGAVAMVKGDVLENRPIANVGVGLQGALPGVNIVSSTGQPGSSPSINIRGINTINSSTSPLVLIDGVAGGDMNLLNPSDIESVSVLKDAASAAIYGARAANGVILITTKKGKNQEVATFTYSGYYGVQTPIEIPELVNGRQYMELSNEAMVAAGFAAPYTQEAFQKYDSGNYPNEYSNTDWVDEIYKKSAPQTGHTFSVKGGSEKSSYFFSYGYLNQDGLVVGDEFKSNRHNARLNVETEVFDRLKLNGNISFVDFYRSESGASGTGGVFRLAQRMSPLLPVRWQAQDENGIWSDTEYWSSGTVKNPLQAAYDSGNVQRKSRTLNTIINGDLKIINDLHLKGMYSANYYFRTEDEFNPVMPVYFSDGTPSPENENLRNYIRREARDVLTQSLNVTLNYQKEVQKHEIGALLGFSQEWSDYGDLDGSRKNILLDNVYVLDAGTEDITNGGTKYSWGLRSYFGRLNYAFAGKYLVEANMRIDGTSRFADNNRWGYFPSFSVGWNFARENFMQFASNILSSGKIRTSWGELGNQNIGGNYYPYLTPINRVEKSYPIGGINNVGFTQSKLGNRNIKWETLRMFNIGADLSFLEARLNTSFDWYKKQNRDALVQPIFPTIVGISGSSNLPYENMGEIENIGWEWQLSWRDKIGALKYKLIFNLSDSKNEITDLGKSAPSLGNYLRREGDPINAFYGFKTDGLAQVSDFEGKDENGQYYSPDFATPVASQGIVQPGDIKYSDISGPDGKPDGIIDDNDKVVFGENNPHYIYSFKGEFQYRAFDFSFYLQGVGEVNGYLSEEARHCFINDYSVPKIEHLDRWTPNNTNATYPRLYQSQTHNLLFSDYWLEDASYLRLKNITLGYTLPEKWLKSVGVSKLRAYMSADNILTFTDYFGSFDPELRNSSGDAYPQVETYTMGVVVTF